MKERLIKFLNKILLLGKEKENNKDYVAYTKALNGESIDDGYIFLEPPYDFISSLNPCAGYLYIQYKYLAYKLKKEKIDKLSIISKNLYEC